MSDEQLASQPIGKLLADMETAANAWFPTTHFKRAIEMKVDTLINANNYLVRQKDAKSLTPLLKTTDAAFSLVASRISSGDLLGALELARGMCGETPAPNGDVRTFRTAREKLT